MLCIRKLLFYARLAAGLAFIFVEFVLREIATVVYRCIPFKGFLSPCSTLLSLVPIRRPKSGKVKNLSTRELIEEAGFYVESHYVDTDDGYVLSLQRIPGAPGDKYKGPRPAVLIMHGFMMSSEAWVAGDRTSSLPFILADRGFDVWIGNNRGNKYSNKHVKLRSWDPKYWNFCIDDMARYDVPAMINYITHLTQQEKISYVGFSQGTAQAFAAFSLFPKLRSKISLFCALAPATEVRGLYNPVADALSRLRPEFVYLFLGINRPMLASAMFWRDVLPPWIHARFIDFCLLNLFGWTQENIEFDKKPKYYAHLYSPSSVKNVVHWFKIIRAKKFVMYDDNMESSSLVSTPEYYTEGIDCPVAMFYGGRDNVPDMTGLLGRNKPRGTVYIQEEPLYEHLDFLWARSAPKCIYEKVKALLVEHAPENTMAAVSG